MSEYVLPILSLGILAALGRGVELFFKDRREARLHQQKLSDANSAQVQTLADGLATIAPLLTEHIEGTKKEHEFTRNVLKNSIAQFRDLITELDGARKKTVAETTGFLTTGKFSKK